MATQTRGRTDDDEMVDEAGRRHDSRGRFVSDEGNDRGSDSGRSGESKRNGSAGGRERDDRGRFESSDEDDDSRGRSRQEASRGGSQDRERDDQGRFRSEDEGEERSSRGRRGGRSRGGVISRAIRVLDEIESRLHELREELEEEGGGSEAGGRGSRSSRRDRDDEDDSSGGGRGRVLHPESDRRLKQNRDD